jgi:hypothetical protein
MSNTEYNKYKGPIEAEMARARGIIDDAAKNRDQYGVDTTGSDRIQRAVEDFEDALDRLRDLGRKYLQGL